MLAAFAQAPGSVIQARIETGPESYALSQCALVQLGDPARLYFARADSTLAAVDLSTGRALWHTKLAVFPIMVRGDRLLALMPLPAGTYGWRLAVLSTRSGSLLSRLPVWGQGGWEGTVGDGVGSRTTMWGVTKDGWDFVAWELNGRPVSGAYLKVARPGYTKTGAAQVDLVRGTLVPVSQEFSNPDLPVQMIRQGGYRLGPFDVAGLTVVAVAERRGDRLRIALNRSRGAEPLPVVELCEVPWNSAGVSVSVDRRHVVGACQSRPWSGSARDRYDLVVHSTITGGRVGHVVSTAFPGRWVMWKDRLVFYVPERVVVEDLGSWQGSVRATPQVAAISGTLSAAGQACAAVSDRPRPQSPIPSPVPATPVIRKLPDGRYRLYSLTRDRRTGKRRNLGTFRTRAEAERHERAIQYFKRLGPTRRRT